MSYKIHKNPACNNLECNKLKATTQTLHAINYNVSNQIANKLCISKTREVNQVGNFLKTLSIILLLQPTV